MWLLSLCVELCLCSSCFAAESQLESDGVCSCDIRVPRVDKNTVRLCFEPWFWLDSASSRVQRVACSVQRDH